MGKKTVCFLVSVMALFVMILSTNITVKSDTENQNINITVSKKENSFYLEVINTSDKNLKEISGQTSLPEKLFKTASTNWSITELKSGQSKKIKINELNSNESKSEKYKIIPNFGVSNNYIYVLIGVALLALLGIAIFKYKYKSILLFLLCTGIIAGYRSVYALEPVSESIQSIFSDETGEQYIFKTEINYTIMNSATSSSSSDTESSAESSTSSSSSDTESSAESSTSSSSSDTESSAESSTSSSSSDTESSAESSTSSSSSDTESSAESSTSSSSSDTESSAESSTSSSSSDTESSAESSTSSSSSDTESSAESSTSSSSSDTESSAESSTSSSSSDTESSAESSTSSSSSDTESSAESSTSSSSSDTESSAESSTSSSSSDTESSAESSTSSSSSDTESSAESSTSSEKFVLSGTVYDDNQTPIINNTLIITGENNEEYFVNTDNSGYFVARLPVKKSYKILDTDSSNLNVSFNFESNNNITNIVASKGSIVFGKSVNYGTNGFIKYLPSVRYISTNDVLVNSDENRELLIRNVDNLQPGDIIAVVNDTYPQGLFFKIKTASIVSDTSSPQARLILPPSWLVVAVSITASELIEKLNIPDGTTFNASGGFDFGDDVYTDINYASTGTVGVSFNGSGIQSMKLNSHNTLGGSLTYNIEGLSADKLADKLIERFPILKGFYKSFAIPSFPIVSIGIQVAPVISGEINVEGKVEVNYGFDTAFQYSHSEWDKMVTPIEPNVNITMSNIVGDGELKLRGGSRFAIGTGELSVDLLGLELKAGLEGTAYLFNDDIDKMSFPSLNDLGVFSELDLKGTVGLYQYLTDTIEDFTGALSNKGALQGDPIIEFELYNKMLMGSTKYNLEFDDGTDVISDGQTKRLIIKNIDDGTQITDISDWNISVGRPFNKNIFDINLNEDQKSFDVTLKSNSGVPITSSIPFFAYSRKFGILFDKFGIKNFNIGNYTSDSGTNNENQQDNNAGFKTKVFEKKGAELQTWAYPRAIDATFEFLDLYGNVLKTENADNRGVIDIKNVPINTEKIKVYKEGFSYQIIQLTDDQKLELSNGSLTIPDIQLHRLGISYTAIYSFATVLMPRSNYPFSVYEKGKETQGTLLFTGYTESDGFLNVQSDKLTENTLYTVKIGNYQIDLYYYGSQDTRENDTEENKLYYGYFKDDSGRTSIDFPVN